MSEQITPPAPVPEEPTPTGAPEADKPQRDEQGRFIEGNSQDTNKNGTAGRPTDYKSEYCEQIVEFFDVPPFKTVELITTDKRTGRKYANQEFQGSALPTMERFAANIGVDDDTLVEWGKKHPEFAAAVLRAKRLQKDILVTNGLLGLYNGGFAQFVARNFTDMRDKQELDLTSGGKRIKTEPVIISQIASRANETGTESLPEEGQANE